MYLVKVLNDGKIWRRHINQLIKGRTGSDQVEVIPQGISSKIVDKKYGQPLRSDLNVLPLPVAGNVITPEPSPNVAGSSDVIVRRSERVVRQPNRLTYHK